MKEWIKKVFGFGIASFFSDFSHEMTVSLIPVLVTQFVGPAQAPFFLGIISSLTDAFAAFLRLIAGFVSDHLQRKKPLIAVGYAMSAVFQRWLDLRIRYGGCSVTGYYHSREVGYANHHVMRLLQPR